MDIMKDETMVEVARRVIGMEVVCRSCRTVLHFQKEDLKDRIIDKWGIDMHYQCIDCPVCGKELIVRNAETECWGDDVDMIYGKERNLSEEL